MTKSAPDPQVEDVLSSVRRLVSGELPRNERPALPEGPEALVLTDDQRIESTAAIRIAGRTLEERIAELEAAVGETANDDDFEPDGSEDQAEHRPDRIVYTRPPAPEEEDQMRRNTLRLSQIALIDTGPVSDDAEEGSDTQLQFRRDSATSEPVDEAPMAEDVKSTLTAAEVHAFTSPDEEIDRIEARLNGEAEPEPKPRLAEDVLALSDVAKEDVAQQDDTESETDQAASEPMIAELAIEHEPEEPEERAEHHAQCDPNPTTEELAEVLELRPETTDDAFDADLEEAVSSVEGAENDAPETVETGIATAAIGATVGEMLDEDTLRPVVAKLIREELQGELGERITRNVRKLVRREILRALAARDVE